VNVWYRGLVQYDLKQFVTDITSCGSDHWRSTEHHAHQIQYGRYGAEGTVVVFERSFLQGADPGVNFL
jgi:hypothetical protein